jgi:hypothetical protein
LLDGEIPTMADNANDKASEQSLATQRQMEIYKWGLVKKTPSQPVSVEGLAREAESVMKKEVCDYVAGGAGSEETIRANLEAFRRRHLVRRQLRGVGRRDLAVEVLGMRLPAPLMLAPVGGLSILHCEAELALARGPGTGNPPDPEHGVVEDDGGGGRRDGRGPALVPALLAQERRAGGQLLAPGREVWLRGGRGDP